MSTQPSYGEHAGTVHEPSHIVSPAALDMAASARIDSFCLINASGGMSMASETCIHAGTHVVGSDELTMAPRSVVCYNAVLLTSSADLRYPASSVVDESERRSVDGGVALGREAFVGSGAVIAPGVDVGAGAVVAASAFVDEDVPEGTVRYPDGSERPRPNGQWRSQEVVGR